MKLALKSHQNLDVLKFLGTVSLACLLGLSLSTSVLAQERLLRTITVTGRGEESIAATIAQIRLGVEIQGKTAAEVQQEVARRSAAVVTLLRSRNVGKLETSEVRLSPVYTYTDNVQRLSGYTASNIVSFRINPNQAGSLLDDAVKAGATRIDSITLVAAEPEIAAAQKQALREATEDAQQQADAVLSVLKLTRKDVVNIQVNGANTPPPVPIADLQFAKTAPTASTPIIAGEQQVEATVTLQISY
ncbi:hypothetical protein BST81_10090 [Leptolyngbya sp. 'hensonii']|uniref:SIMPL domain-containing protein n=1 Tax=Leptolyngbya sp. 'hensonii' TaxID=1922337 RepID=UPI0009500895|nr:SIMPL domain-containing protein [Leptolyngbya sp. 'hensonii']OLP18625.1 hypothetical protein BST81_10090 [Leptolyngbya sp. 'hensonii']